MATDSHTTEPRGQHPEPRGGGSRPQRTHKKPRGARAKAVGKQKKEEKGTGGRGGPNRWRRKPEPRGNQGGATRNEGPRRVEEDGRKGPMQVSPQPNQGGERRLRVKLLFMRSKGRNVRRGYYLLFPFFSSPTCCAKTAADPKAQSRGSDRQVFSKGGQTEKDGGGIGGGVTKTGQCVC